MTLRLSAQDRARLTALRAEERQLLRPLKEAKRQERKGDQKARARRVGKTAVRQRKRRERDPGYLAWLRRLICTAGLVKGSCSGPIEAAHLRFSDAARGRINPGMGRKPDDRFATPLCNGHHQCDQHKRRERDFWADLGIEPGQLTDDLYAAYLAGAEGLPVLLEHARKSPLRKGGSS